MPVSFPAALLLIQLSTDAFGRAGADDPSVWAPGLIWESGKESVAAI